MKYFLNAIIVSICFVVPIIVKADSFPSFPMSFYGKATINDNNLPTGTKIQAYSAGVLVGEVVMTENGVYGYNASTKSKLVVGEYTGNQLLFKYLPAGSSLPLTGEMQNIYTHSFVSGDVEELNINFTKSSPVLSSGNNETAINKTDIATTTISIPLNVVAPKINLTSLATSTSAGTEATLPSRMEIKATTSIGRVEVSMPAETIIKGDNNWHGVINAPTIKENNSVSVSSDAGKTSTVNSVIEIGFDDVKLTFTKAARIILYGQAGKDAGYSRGGVFSKITNICPADTQAVGDSLSVEGDCRIDVGNDLVIWTKHFTKFISYTQQTSSNGGSGGGGGGGGSAGPAEVIKPVIVATTTATSTIAKEIKEATSTEVIKEEVIIVATTTIIKIENNKTAGIVKGIKIYFDKEKSLAKKDDKVVNKLKGMILIQAEEQGQSWYVNPKDGKKYYLGRPSDAFAVMRKLGLGVKHAVIAKKQFGSSLIGKILIDTEDKGKAYYVNPKDKKAYFLGKPADAFAVMRKLGLGISNVNIRKIEVGE